MPIDPSKKLFSAAASQIYEALLVRQGKPRKRKKAPLRGALGRRVESPEAAKRRREQRELLLYQERLLSESDKIAAGFSQWLSKLNAESAHARLKNSEEKKLHSKEFKALTKAFGSRKGVTK